MKISVIIPAYNAGATIEATLNAVLAQSVAPYEILVFDDGSTDNTPVVLEGYKSRIRIFRQPNGGVAHARNFLCSKAQGDILAFLDADDLWHPGYLEMQLKLFHEYPNAVAFFTDHDRLLGHGVYHWEPDAARLPSAPELISPVEFLLRYDKTPLFFQMSCFCIRRRTLADFGDEPFPVKVSGADDTYVHHLLPLLGPVVHAPVPLVAYRIIGSSISSNRLKMALAVVEVFQMLDGLYEKHGDKALYKTFTAIRASRSRNCGKFLMGAGRFPDARRQFLLAARTSRSPSSIAKSIGLFGLSHLPQSLQPCWPVGQRLLNDRALQADAGSS